MTSLFDNLRIKRNAIATVIQVLVSGLVFFILYRYLYDSLGVEQIGVWSLVLATTAVSRIGDLGLSAGVVKFVAQALGRNDAQRAADVIQTVALTLALFMSALLIAGYPLFVLALEYFLPPSGVPIALSILPYALMSLWVMVLVSVFSGGLDGCMRMDLRSLLMGLSHLIYLGLTIMLVPKYGLDGVAKAQLIQSVGLMIFLWWMLRRQLKPLPLIPLSLKLPVLKEMMGYGVNFQIITIMNMLFDPMVKAMMSRYGGLEALGYYEMANKLILQGRAVIVEASRVMVPAIAMFHEHDAAKTARMFAISYRMTFYVSVLFYGLLGIFITAISMLWLGHYQETFIQYALLLNFGWFTNTLVGPAYFSNLGTGKLKANMISHAVMGLCSLLVGLGLGVVYEGLGVVLGTVSGLVFGSIFLQVSFIKQGNLKWPDFIVPKEMVKLLVIGILVTILANYASAEQSSLVAAIAFGILCGAFLLLSGWFNPVRMVMMEQIYK